MPIKKDGSGKRWVEMELLVPGTPEQVWQAMATGPGYAAWFVASEIEPRFGGVLRFDFGAGVATSGQVTAWQPPHAFGYVEREWSGDAPPIATEITITGREGNQCVVRMVHSLFTELDTWDNEIEGFESGWPGFFVVLRAYLAHFAGAPAASFVARAEAQTDSLASWLRLSEALGLAGANVGERRSASSGPEAWTGVVEHVLQDGLQRYVLVRLEAPSPGLALVGTQDKCTSTESARPSTSSVSVCRYFYGDAVARAAESEAGWRAWLDATFGGQTATTSA